MVTKDWRNDPNFVQMVLDVVNKLGISVHLKTIEQMKTHDENEWAEGYDAAIDDVLELLKEIGRDSRP